MSPATPYNAEVSHVDQKPYNPLPVPERDLTHPSIRDDVRRVIRKHDFQPSCNRYSQVRDIYELYLRETAQDDTSALEERFRSALGRVLRPPATACEYAQSYSMPQLKRLNGMLSIVSPNVRQIDPVSELREAKWEKGRRRREVAKTDKDIAELRRVRREKEKDVQVAKRQEVSFRYVDEFVGLNCAEDLMRLKVFPNGKELAESMSAYAAVRQYLHIHRQDHEESDGILSFKDKNVLLVAVGDGVTPRTACLFAFRSAWRCVSIDPEMRLEGEYSSVANLQMIKAKVQQATVPVRKDERVVVVMWHCHVSIAQALGCLEFQGVKWDVKDKQVSHELRKQVALVTCACCNYDKVQQVMPDDSPPDAEFEDIAVPSLMRTVKVWKHVK